MSEERRWAWPDVPGYELVSVLGRGGFGVVYEAVQRSVERRVALKVLHAAHVDDAMERRFRAESRAIGALSWHPHVVSLYDAGVTPSGEPYLVMELVPGGSLGVGVRERRPLDPGQVCAVGVQLADALAAAHEAGVLHRDVKPDNVLVDRRGSCLLGDFGIATLQDDTRSASGQFTGTFAFSAPELLRGERASERSDLYSLGATLHALANGRPPFWVDTDASPAAEMFRIVSEPTPPLIDSVPPPLAALIASLMDKDPEGRPVDAATVRERLRALAASPAAGHASTPAPPVEPQAPPSGGAAVVGPEPDPVVSGPEATHGPGPVSAEGPTVARPGPPADPTRAVSAGAAAPPSQPRPATRPGDGLVDTQRVAPTVFADPGNALVATSYFGVRITSAVNLLEAREYAGLDRGQRLQRALTEQQAFLNSLLAVTLDAAFDLRMVVTPGDPVPIEFVLLGRTWASSAELARGRAQLLQDQVAASLPRHVVAVPLPKEEVPRYLQPVHGTAMDTALITKAETTGIPSRPDAKVPYYFSIAPFNWAGNDWTGLYAALAQSQTPLVLSVGLLPMAPPPQFAQLLNAMATFYGRLAQEDQRKGGLYFGEQKLPPDAFAVEAEKVFQDVVRRCGQRAFGMRVQVAAPGALPPGVVEAIAAAVSPVESVLDTHLSGARAGATYEVRRPKSAHEAAIARWNFETIDFRHIAGRPEIWQRPDPPHPGLGVLATIADASDASCAFRLPIAVDGVVPGFRVGRGSFGQAEAYGTDAPSVTLGHLSGTSQPVSLPLTSLTKHALIAGSTGSGKTTTVLELLRQLWVDHHVPFLVIEPVNSDADDYRRFLGQPGFEDFEVVTIGDDAAAPLRFNPFEVPANTIVGEHAANLLACFKAAFGLWEPLPSIYQDALDLTYLRAGILASERSGEVERRWPTAVEFMRSMSEVTSELQYAGEVKSNIEAASIRRAQQMASGPTASTFLTDQPGNIGRLLDHPVVLELKSLGTGDEQALMIALLLNAMTEHYQAVRGASPTLAHVTVIEEAHRLLARPSGGKSGDDAQAKEKAAESFANTLAENRKYGEGIIIAEQIPVKLVEDAVKNTGLKVMHRLTAEDDRRYLGESMGMDEAQMRFTTRLKTGEAVVYSDEFSEATHLDIPRTITGGGDTTVHHRPAPPFDACARCRAKCRYRGAALAIVRDPKVLGDLEAKVAILQDSSQPKEEQPRRWKELLEALRGRVRDFRTLPSDGPELEDAAYCLFLHSLAIRTMRFSPAWPKAVAGRLGIPEPEPPAPSDEGQE